MNLGLRIVVVYVYVEWMLERLRRKREREARRASKRLNRMAAREDSEENH
jgi:hypothetical protein